MPRHAARFITGSTFTVLIAASAFAQGISSRPVLISQQAALRDGSILGSVRDDGGRAIAGVSVIALGAAPMPIMALSDTTGRFELALPPGDYILRAMRQGYVSTYREPVRVQSSILLERNIVLVRQGNAPDARTVLQASTGPAAVDPAQFLADEPGDHPHNETAWRLRHLTPTALREIGASEADGIGGESSASSFKQRASLTRAAASFFTNTEFSGQVNFLTTSSLAAASGWITSSVPRGVAYLSVGAPVGALGKWNVRGALPASNTSSWVVLGEYSGREDQRHALNLGVSYSSLVSANSSGASVASVNDQARSVGGIYGSDRWQIWPALTLDYGLRFDRYDYVAGSTFLSPRVGARLALLGGTHLTMLASERAIAPGGEEFLPPPSAGPWLPPERTFSPLIAGALFRAERVRNYEVGVEQRVGPAAGGLIVGLRRFRQTADHQIATLFGLDAETQVGHYYVATPGAVVVDGWIMHMAGNLTRQVRGSIDYSVCSADWTAGWQAYSIARVAAAAVRTDERMHDLTSSIEASTRDHATRVLLAYRLNTAFSRPQESRRPALDGRFDLELHQALPFEPVHGSKLELLLEVRSLFRDLGDAGSVYDELLTVTPPRRILGGVQVKF